jgi:hypothetical protein
VNTSLSISEDGGDLEFEIAVLSGVLRFDVLVNFATADGVAIGIEHCIHSPLQLWNLEYTLLICSWIRLSRNLNIPNFQ